MFTAKAVRELLELAGVSTRYIELGSPWEAGYIKSFYGRLRNKLLNGELFTKLCLTKCLSRNDGKSKTM